MKHTQGEWLYAPHMNEQNGRKSVTVDDGTKYHRHITIATIEEHPQRPIEAEANAKLIAAAPDLLEALQEANEYFDVCDKNCIPLPLHKRIKAAIKKASE